MGSTSPAAAVTPVTVAAEAAVATAVAAVAEAVTGGWVPAGGGDMMQTNRGGRRYCGGGVGRGGRAEQHCAGYRGGANCTSCEATSGSE